MADHLLWGIIGAGNIAGSFARDLPQSRTGRLHAIASRSQEKAEAFRQKFACAKAYGSYDALLADPDVRAVYVATPHPQHAEWVIKAANAGKHILCEKPMATHAWATELMIEAARAGDVFLMEAFMYRCSPQTARVVELVKSGVLGEVRMISAAFGFRAPFDEKGRLFNARLAGGGILDVGCYPVSFARLIAGAVAGQPCAEPGEVKAMGHLEATGVDGYTAALLRFGNDLIAQVSCAVSVRQENGARIYGTEGSLHLTNPWGPGDRGAPSKITLTRSGKREDIEITVDRPMYAIEADVVAEHVAAGRREATQMPWCDSMGNARTLDRWRREIGVRYPSESYENFPAPLPKPRKRITGEITIPRIEIAGVKKPMSRLVMGLLHHAGAAGILFDHYFAAGGNVFDTSWHYGTTDHTLGAWIESRGVRKDVAILAKGAHTPWCDPVNLDKQIRESVEHLRTDFVELYIMHRDNPQVPVGEFVDVLNRHVREGRVGVFGGSNWSLDRIAEANEYAEKHGLQGMGVLSNNFSLARMVKPVWDGCIAASDPESRRLLTEWNMPNFAWSSQARGFFVRGDPAFTKDRELSNAWYSDDNFERLRRARELGERKGVTANNVALAYVLAQPWPQFALVGPANLDELRTTLPALTVTLTPDELAWLNLEK